jgi:signal transduction histidine kinase
MQATVEADAASHRVLVAPATVRDGIAVREALRHAGIASAIPADLRALAGEVQAGAGALILTDNALVQQEIALVLAALGQQPAWSDLPVVLMTPTAQLSPLVGTVVARLTNVTLLDRPTSVRMLTSAVQTALRARRRQYQLRDQIDALRAAEEALRVADRRKDEFLATLAHELRNPLAPLRSALQVIHNGPPGDPRVGAVLSIMDRQMDVMVRLIDDLLDVARISSGKVVLQREHVDLRASVDAALEIVRPAIESARHALALDVPAQPVWCLGDPTRLAQVIGNLLSNAVKYTPDGGHIDVSLGSGRGEAVLCVADDGVGIPPGQITGVFDMFAQINRTLDRAQGGLGIGLALVRHLVQLHGGRIEAVSEGAGHGCAFTVRLPLLATGPQAFSAPRPADGQGFEGRGGGGPRAGAHPADDAGDGPARRPLRILVVDDNRDAADTLALLLDIEGHATRVEYGGAAALRTAAEFDPEVVFCDIGLPGMTGHEVAGRLRADGVAGAAVLVAVTGWGTDEDKRRTRAAGFDYHLTKPVSVDMLRDILAALGVP